MKIHRILFQKISYVLFVLTKQDSLKELWPEDSRCDFTETLLISVVFVKIKTIYMHIDFNIITFKLEILQFWKLRENNFISTFRKYFITAKVKTPGQINIDWLPLPRLPQALHIALAFQSTKKSVVSPGNEKLFIAIVFQAPWQHRKKHANKQKLICWRAPATQIHCSLVSGVMSRCAVTSACSNVSLDCFDFWGNFESKFLEVEGVIGRWALLAKECSDNGWNVVS